MDRRTDGWTDERTDERKISPFYKTLSPIGAAALPPPMKTKEKVEQGKGTADHLMPLGHLFSPALEISFTPSRTLSLSLFCTLSLSLSITRSLWLTP